MFATKCRWLSSLESSTCLKMEVIQVSTTFESIIYRVSHSVDWLTRFAVPLLVTRRGIDASMAADTEGSAEVPKVDRLVLDVDEAMEPEGYCIIEHRAQINKEKKKVTSGRSGRRLGGGGMIVITGTTQTRPPYILKSKGHVSLQRMDGWMDNAYCFKGFTSTNITSGVGLGLGESSLEGFFLDAIQQNGCTLRFSITIWRGRAGRDIVIEAKKLCTVQPFACQD